MKLGNTSQSIVSVPNFYFNRTLGEKETFTLSDRKRYFREQDLFRMTKDLNFSNNQRKNYRKYDELNKEKYIPIHKLDQNLKNSTQIKDEKTKFLPDLSEKQKEQQLKTNGGFRKFNEYMERTNITKNTQGDLREDIRNNINTLLDRVNSNFDMSKWNQYDTKTNFANHNEILYTPITFYNQTHDTESTKFRKTLLDKVSSLTVVNELSKGQAKYYLDRMSDENKNDELPLPNVLNNDRTSFITTTRSQYRSFSPFQNSTLNFPSIIDKTNRDSVSPTRLEFSKKRGEKISFKRKKIEDYLVNKNKYNVSNHNEIYSDGYNTNGSALKTFKTYSEMKTTFS